MVHFGESQQIGYFYLVFIQFWVKIPFLKSDFFRMPNCVVPYIHPSRMIVISHVNRKKQNKTKKQHQKQNIY